MKKGFTLIEILIVVAIVAILSSLVIVGLGPTGRAGRDARRIADLRQVQTGLELYFNRCGHYPGAPVTGIGPCTNSAPANWDALRQSLTQSGLGIANVPNDPQFPAKTYGYAYDAVRSTYQLGAQLEDLNNSALREDIDGVVSPLVGTPGFDTCDDPWYCIAI